MQRLAFVSPHSLIDFTSGAATATRDAIKFLAGQGFACEAFCGTRMDAPEETLVQGLMSLLDEIADQAHDHYGLDSLIKDEPAKDEPAKLETVVMRRSNDENTVAILRCDRTATISDAAALRDALRRAISDWGDRMCDGRDAYAENGNDFNLGDVAQWDDDPTLLKFMELHGIKGFTIEIVSDTCPAPGWAYDDNLVEADRVNGLDAATKP